MDVDNKWSNLLDDYLDSDGFVSYVPTSVLSDTFQEVRLYTKIDHRKDLPEPLAKRNLSILPLKNRGNYALVQGDMFQSTNFPSSSEQWESVQDFDLETLDGDRIGEQKYILKAVWSGMLADFLGVDELYQTISGREYSKPFTFKFGDAELDVKSVQMEVDAGFEVPEEEQIVLVEAKKRSRDKVESFNLRQLYYPYRQYRKKYPSYDVRTVFFVHDDEGNYNFLEYEFPDPKRMDNAELKHSKAYSLVDKETLNIWSVIDDTEIQSGVVPQADDLEKVLQVPYLILSGADSAMDIIEELDGLDTERQGNYYRQAAESLNLNDKYELTEQGRRYVDEDTTDWSKTVITVLASNKIVNESLQKLRENDKLSSEDVYDIIENHSDYNHQTCQRRTRTIMSWLRWVKRNSDELSEDEEGCLVQA